MNECFMSHHTKQLAFEAINTQVHITFNQSDATARSIQLCTEWCWLTAAAKYTHSVRNTVT